MSSINVVCPNQRRHTIKVTPGTLLHKVVEEACLKSGYNVNTVVAKNQNKLVDLALPFRLSGLPNNATLELTVMDKPRSESVDLALQLPDGRRQIAALPLVSALRDVLNHFSTVFGEDLMSLTGGAPCCIYMSRKYVGPELEHTTLTSMGITGGKCLLRYQKVEMTDEDFAKLVHKAAEEQQKLASLSSTFEEAKKDNEERERLERDRMERFEAEMSAKAEEEERKRREEEAEKEKSTMDVDPQPVRDRLPEPATNPGWSFDSPFAQQQAQPEAPRRNEMEVEPSNRLDRLNSLLERVDHSISSGGADNMVQAIAESGRMSLQQLESAAEAMDTEPEPPARVFEEPCTRQTVIFARVEEAVHQEQQPKEDVPEGFFDVSVDDIKAMQKDLKEQVRQQTQRSLVPRSFLEKKNRELKLEAYKHTVIRFVVGDQLIQTNFKSGEPVSRLFSEAASFFRELVDVTLTAIPNLPVAFSETKNLIEADVAPKSTLMIKLKGGQSAAALLRDDIPRISHVEGDLLSKEWLAVNSLFKVYTGVMAGGEEERPFKRAADVKDYAAAPGGGRPAAPSGPKWFKHK